MPPLMSLYEPATPIDWEYIRRVKDAEKDFPDDPQKRIELIKEAEQWHRAKVKDQAERQEQARMKLEIERQARKDFPFAYMLQDWCDQMLAICDDGVKFNPLRL